MKGKPKLLLCGLLLVAILFGTVAVGKAAETSGTLRILPDVYLPDVPEEDRMECNHLFDDSIELETVTIQLDEYFYCYMEISVNAKVCKRCAVTAYDLDYKLFPHEGNETLCKRCEKLLTPPVIAAPLGI